MAEIIDNIDVFGEGICPIWTIQTNEGHYVFITNKTNRYIEIKFEFSGDSNTYLGKLDNTDIDNKNNIFGVMIHGVSFRNNFNISIWDLMKNGDENNGNSDYVYKTIIWN